jgi:membrane-associated phospholipid phosphatase
MNSEYIVARVSKENSTMKKLETRFRFKTLAAATVWLSLLMAYPARGAKITNAWDIILADHREFYSTPSLLYMAGGVVVGGVLANTSLDEDLRDWYQDDFRSSGTDSLADLTKPLGNGIITVPIMVGAAALGLWGPENEWVDMAGDWGQISLRSILVGAPPLLVMQQVLGSGRPSDGSDSKWEPFEAGNGVSGHAFMGAIPFLVAADMSDHWAARSAWYAASTLCGISRINDDDHYLSQVMLGWGLAYLSTSAVSRSHDKNRMINLGMFADGDYLGLGMRMGF